ncbi:MAG: hypothetical protein LBF08_08160 [Dysgonamonadaceae bacterium]|nr:hypothetical protein [Dysgonamonadaceae bacterium]
MRYEKDNINFAVFSATFTLKYGSTNLSSINVSVFQNGTMIGSQSTNSSGIVTIALPTGNYSYKTASNFVGDISILENFLESNSVTLDHKKLTFTVKDNQNNPIRLHEKLYRIKYKLLRMINFTLRFLRIKGVVKIGSLWIWK